jgi:C4-dicarboxylate-specific signal transduction histidine kinase
VGPDTIDLRRAVDRTGVIAGARLTSPLEVESPAVVPVLGDQDTIGRVVLNLVLNAAEALAGDPHGRVRVRITEAPGVAICDVSDNGPGLSSAARERLFQTQALTGGAEGTRGLGLAVSRALMREMGGELELLATGPGGTCFRLVLRAPAPAE